MLRTPESFHLDEHPALYAATNAFSKKVENHAAAVAFWFIYCNLPSASKPESDPGDGGWHFGSRLDSRKNLLRF